MRSRYFPYHRQPGSFGWSGFPRRLSTIEMRLSIAEEPDRALLSVTLRVHGEGEVIALESVVDVGGVNGAVVGSGRWIGPGPVEVAAWAPIPTLLGELGAIDPPFHLAQLAEGIGRGPKSDRAGSVCGGWDTDQDALTGRWIVADPVVALGGVESGGRYRCGAVARGALIHRDVRSYVAFEMGNDEAGLVATGARGRGPADDGGSG